MKRENNYDALRIISAIAVIIMHVSAPWFADAVQMTAVHNADIGDLRAPFLICIYDAISRFAVPCFLMLSGAFIIDSHKNVEYKNFYARAFSNIGVPTLVFSGLYILYRIPLCFVGEERGIAPLAKDVIAGVPMYHMWYLYMLVGIYALAPIVIRFEDSVAEKTFYRVSLVFLALACISRWITGNAALSWSPGRSFEYLGFFMAGYSIRRIFAEKNSRKAVMLIGAGVLLETGAAALEYRQIADGIQELKYQIVSPVSPLIVSAAVCIFIGFTLLDVKKECGKLSGLTFYIYLIHAGVWDVMQKGCRIAWGGGNRVKWCGLDSRVCWDRVRRLIPAE